MRHLLFVLLCCPLLMGAASRSFDGTNDVISMGNTNVVTTGDVTVSLWVKTTEDATTDFFIGKKPDVGAVAAGYVMREGTGDLSACGVADGAVFTGCGGGTTDLDGAWNYVSLVWNGTSDVATNYVNAVSENSGTAATGSLSNADNFTIGEDAAGANDMAGLAAYGSMHAAALTVVELTEMRWHVCSLPTNLDGCWPLWGDSTEIDLSGNGRTGTVTAATTSTDGPPTMVGGYLPL